jgi:ABC-type antimicrobial peptide transport system permease subunit
MSFTAAGIVIGLIGAFALTRLLGSMLFAVSVTDGATFFLVPVAVALVSCLAGYVPAKRAARVDPLEVLRHE